MLTELILEGLVATLLAVTVGYCFVLNRRLSTLRNGQDGLLEVVRSLNVATEQARASVRELHETGETVGERLSEKVAKARLIADELSLIVESGNNLADRLTADATERRPALARSSEREELPRSEPLRDQNLPTDAGPDGDATAVAAELRQALRAVR